MIALKIQFNQIALNNPRMLDLNTLPCFLLLASLVYYLLLAGLFPWIKKEGLMALLFKQLKRDLNVFTGLQELLVEEQLLVGLS